MASNPFAIIHGEIPEYLDLARPTQEQARNPTPPARLVRYRAVSGPRIQSNDADFRHETGVLWKARENHQECSPWRASVLRIVRRVCRRPIQ